MMIIKPMNPTLKTILLVILLSFTWAIAKTSANYIGVLVVPLGIWFAVYYIAKKTIKSNVSIIQPFSLQLAHTVWVTAGIAYVASVNPNQLPPPIDLYAYLFLAFTQLVILFWSIFQLKTWPAICLIIINVAHIGLMVSGISMNYNVSALPAQIVHLCLRITAIVLVSIYLSGLIKTQKTARTNDDNIVLLERLSKLREQGTISQIEFEEKKRELLNRI